MDNQHFLLLHSSNLEAVESIRKNAQQHLGVHVKPVVHDLTSLLNIVNSLLKASLESNNAFRLQQPLVVAPGPTPIRKRIVLTDEGVENLKRARAVANAQAVSTINFDTPQEQDVLSMLLNMQAEKVDITYKPNVSETPEPPKLVPNVKTGVAPPRIVHGSENFLLKPGETYFENGQFKPEQSTSRDQINFQTLQTYHNLSNMYLAQQRKLQSSQTDDKDVPPTVCAESPVRVELSPTSPAKSLSKTALDTPSKATASPLSQNSQSSLLGRKSGRPRKVPANEPFTERKPYDIISFLRLVSSRPYLYDEQHEGFNDPYLKDAAFAEIENKCNSFLQMHRIKGKNALKLFEELKTEFFIEHIRQKDCGFDKSLQPEFPFYNECMFFVKHDRKEKKIKQELEENSDEHQEGNDILLQSVFNFIRRQFETIPTDEHFSMKVKLTQCVIDFFKDVSPSSPSSNPNSM